MSKLFEGEIGSRTGRNSVISQRQHHFLTIDNPSEMMPNQVFLRNLVEIRAT